MRTQIVQKVAQSIYYILPKIGRHLVSGLYTDVKALERIKMLQVEPQNRVIFVPLNKSVIDLMIFHYVNYFHGLDLGVTFGSHEDTPDVKLLLKYMGFSGYISPQRTKGYDTNISYVN
jgi:hypothetical protein